MKIILCLILLSLSIATFAYNAKECMTLYPYKESNYKHVLGSTTAPTSITQSITSTGRCSMLGSSKQNQAELFYVLNNEKIISEISIGKGEYLDALDNLLGCNSYYSLKKIKESHLDFESFVKQTNAAQFLILESNAKSYCRPTST